MNKEDMAMVKRIKLAVEKQCNKCEFQDGKYCSWWKEKRLGNPPCQTKHTHYGVLVCSIHGTAIRKQHGQSFCVKCRRVKPLKYYTVEQAKRAGFTLEPIICEHCNHIGEVQYNQVVNDFYCAWCGYWYEEIITDRMNSIVGPTQKLE